MFNIIKILHINKKKRKKSKVYSYLNNIDVRNRFFSVILHEHFIMRTIWHQSRYEAARALKFKYSL